LQSGREHLFCLRPITKDVQLPQVWQMAERLVRANAANHCAVASNTSDLILSLASMGSVAILVGKAFAMLAPTGTGQPHIQRC
jgi:hypothetical protein